MSQIDREGSVETYAGESVLELLGEDAEDATGTLNILDESGDSRIQWNKDNPEQVAAAKARFDELKAKGYLAYDASTNEVMQSFDPGAERLILHQRMVGG
jgi:hypothetical protein